MRTIRKLHNRHGIRSIYCSASIAIGEYDMGFGKMNTFVDIVAVTKSKDEEGFAINTDEILASVRAYREGRHGTQKWANLAAFSEATELFRFRVIPGLTVTSAHFLVCADDRYEITSVEDVKGRGMYLEALAKKVVSTVGKS